MTTTTDFQEFLDNIIEIDLDEINDLYETVSNGIDYGSYQYTITEDGRIFIKNTINNITLLLATEKAKRTFLDMLDDEWKGVFISVPAHWDFIRISNKE